MDIDEIVGPAIRAARSEGADEAEAYAVQAHTWSAYVDDSKIKSVEEKRDLGIAIRVIREGRVGQSTSVVASMADVESCVRSAVRVSRLIPSDPVFKHFPSSERPGVWARCSDQNVHELDNQELVSILKDVVKAAHEPGKVKVPNGILRAGRVQARTTNTNGVDVCRDSTLVYMHVTSMTEGDRPGEGTEVFYSPRIRELEPGAIGKRLKEKAKAASKAEAFSGRSTLDVIIDPNELAEMMQGSVLFALSMENVNRRRSGWVSKVGEQVASKGFDLVDDPGDERGMLSTPFDDEGVPTRRKELIKDGVLRGFVNDSYNSYLSGQPMTGNGLRRSPIEPLGQWRIPVGVGGVNVVLRKGDKSVDDIVSATDKGLLVEKFAAPNVHPLTGGFGLEVRCGHLIQNGRISKTIKHCLAVGNMFDALKRVRHIGNDATTTFNCILPSVSFADIELAGSG